MLKKTILLAVILNFTSLFAQTEDEAYVILANETCECINKKGLDMTKNQIKANLGVCMLNSLGRNKEKFKKANLHFSMNDYESGRALGEKVGVKMAVICPEVFMVFMDEETTDKFDDTATKPTTISGVIKSISDGDISYIAIFDLNNKVQQFIWLRNFEGSDKVIENEKAVIGKKVKIEFVNTECYIPKMKKYYMLKEIVKMEFIE